MLQFINPLQNKIFLQVYHVAEGREKNPKFFDEDLEDHQPFPTLQTVLQELEQHVGCNIEIKWTMQLKVKVINLFFYLFSIFIILFLLFYTGWHVRA